MSAGRRFGAAVAAGVAFTLAAGLNGNVRAADGVLVGGPGSIRQPDVIVDEVKVGVLDHDVNIGGHHKEGGVDVNGEILFTSPEFFYWIVSPRPHFGFDVNTSGNTNVVYAGFTWTFLSYDDVFAERDKFFFNFSFGPSLNDGKLNKDNLKRHDLGSHVLFRESIEFGWQFPTPHRRSLSIFADHVSDAGLTKHNEGLSNLGVRYGVGF